MLRWGGRGGRLACCLESVLCTLPLRGGVGCLARGIHNHVSGFRGLSCRRGGGILIIPFRTGKSWWEWRGAERVILIGFTFQAPSCPPLQWPCFVDLGFPRWSLFVW